MRALRGGLALVILGSVVLVGAVLMACGVNWFPKCDDPKHPCPNVEPDYPPSPPFGAPRRDASITDAGDAG